MKNVFLITDTIGSLNQKGVKAFNSYTTYTEINGFDCLILEPTVITKFN